jgi:predicted Rossmann-fold nucleotide-binding protein
VVGVMGGHSVARTDPVYEPVVRLGFALARAGLLVVTGGGPGVMEAANLGAYLSAGEEGLIDEAMAILASAPTVAHTGYGEAADRAHGLIEGGGTSLAIPTWHYGDEPVGRFASHIAKYFANSIREDGLLRVANAGIVFAAGGPGTVQEVFQDAAINAYAEPAERAPMVFLGFDHFGGSGIWELAGRVAREQDPPFEELLLLTDDVGEAVRFIAG